MYSDLEQRLIANTIDQWCKTKAGSQRLNYNPANNSSYKMIRFTTPFIEKLLLETPTVVKRWGSNFPMVYEFEISGTVTLRCLINRNSLEDTKETNGLKVCTTEYSEDLLALQQWNVIDGKDALNLLNKKLEDLFNNEIQYLENELRQWKLDPSYIIQKERVEELEILHKSELPDSIYIEGARKRILLDKYERNPKARKKCIETYGYKCQICGFDFTEVYGNPGKSIIEVHHKKPISEIGKNYEIDPINDLIPVCSNCHTLLHSRKDRVYSVEEVKNMIKKK